MIEDRLKFERPHLEYRYAYDICTSKAYSSGSSIAIYTDIKDTAREFINRLEDREIHLNQLDRKRPDSTVIWACSTNDPNTIQEIGQALLPNGIVCTIASGPIRGVVSYLGHNKKHAPGKEFARTSSLLNSFHRANLAVVGIYGILGFESLVWGGLARQAIYFKRFDLADRCYFEMREHFVLTNWQAKLAALSVIFLQKNP